MYANENRYTIFQPSAQLNNLAYIRTPNVEIKDASTLNWSISLTQRARVYIMTRHIPGLNQIPTWVVGNYARQTNDDLSRINQYFLRKNEQGLIGLYDISSREVQPGTISFQSANAGLTTAYSMYIVALQPLTTTQTPSPTPVNTSTPLPTISPPPAGTVDASTMDRKFMLGYQGWFQCPTDGSPSATWRHWFNGTPPNGPLIDAWPDTSELTPSERCDTGLKLPSGQPAYLFSAYNQQTVVKHHQWMQQYGIDGVMLQRFTSELSNPAMFAIRNKVASNVRIGSEQTGRVFNIMYDISGQNASTLVATIQNDWKHLVDVQKVTASPRYLKQGGRPLVVIWGFGFADRPGTPSDLRTLLDFFHNNPNPAYRATVMGGVNNDWRTNNTWASTFTGFDAISPWMVGRINSLAGADNYKSTITAEIAYAKAHNQLYMPVIFPGFSFHNQSPANRLNQIPRLGGNFLWRQAYNNLSSGATMLYGAMFDEVNEGTAFFKQAPTSASWPANMTMVPLNTDGYTQLPNDWYLREAGEITKMTRGTIPLSPTMTIIPR